MLLQEGIVQGIREDGFMMDSYEFQKACQSVGKVIGFENLYRQRFESYYTCHLKFQEKEYWVFLNCAYPVMAISDKDFYDWDEDENGTISPPRFIDVPELTEKFPQYRVLSVKELYEPLEYGDGVVRHEGLYDFALHKWIYDNKRKPLTPNMLNVDFEEHGKEETLRHEWVYENEWELPTPNSNPNMPNEEIIRHETYDIKKELLTPNMLNVDERDLVGENQFETFGDAIFNHIHEFYIPDCFPSLYLCLDNEVKYVAYGDGVKEGIERGEKRLQRVYRLLRKDCSDEEIYRKCWWISEEKLQSYKKSFRELFD